MLIDLEDTGAAYSGLFPARIVLKMEQDGRVKLTVEAPGPLPQEPVHLTVREMRKLATYLLWIAEDCEGDV